MMNLEVLKSVNLVEFLSRNYGLVFERNGHEYVCRSPFGEDRNPSFFVRLVEGRWLFKDFSSGIGGSIIDFVQKIEGLPDVSAALKRIRELMGNLVPTGSGIQPMSCESVPVSKEQGYDIEALYVRFRQQSPDPCREYLINRGIEPELVEELIEGGEVVHNYYKERSYCCIAVRDHHGTLKCLDNHEIGGPGKFILGNKSIYTRDWPLLANAAEIFISEGFIDYLSIKTLEGSSLPGLALLGNRLLFETGFLSGCDRIISALDEDTGGSSALIDLMDQYPDKEIKAYDLKGHKDPNELLQALRKGPRRLTAEEKLTLYEQFQQAENKAELARQWGIDRSHMYQIVRDCKELLLSGLTDRAPGRKPKGQPDSMQDACRQIQRLREDNERLTIERDTLHCREKLMGIRLKWSEIEAAELRNDPVDEKTGPKRKPHVRKKRR